MTFTLSEKKENKKLKNIIKILLLTILFVTIALIINFFFTKGIRVAKVAFLNDIGVINYTLAIISMATCWLYYYIHKKTIFFIITLIYFSFGIEYIYLSLILNNEEDGLLRFVPLMVLTYLFRSILILFTILQKNKIVNKLCENKMLSIVITSIITIILIMFETNYIKINLIDRNSKFVIIMSIVMILYHFCILTVLAMRSIKEVEFIYTIIIASISFFTVKRIYSLGNWNGRDLYIDKVSKILTFWGFSILLLGVFIEIIRKVRENELLKQELKVFYDLTEYNQHNNVVMFNEKSELVYANERVRNANCNFSSIVKNKGSYLENIKINRISKNQYENIVKQLKIGGFYKGIVFDCDSKALKLDVQKIHINKDKKVFVATYRDITKDYKTNEKLKINESKLKSITENIKDLIFTIDATGNITYVNNAVIDMLGYEKEEILNNKHSMILDLESINKMNFISESYKNNPYKEHKLKCKNGREIYVESIVNKVANNNDEIRAYVIVARDLTYRNELEALKIKYKEIKEYERIRNEFFANLSHEVRTPINIIYSCLQLLNGQKVKGNEALSEYYNKYETTMRQNCFRMLRLVNNLIDITKIDSGFVKMNFENYNIVSLVEDITLSVVPYVEFKKINIMFDTEYEELYIKCDPDKIERVILNLISNAVKFTEKNGNILVYISADEKFVKIRVKDDGIGIPYEVRGFIFERFVQNDKSLNRGTEGSGIGLALVKSLVELHNGKVYLEDTKEKGSEFVVELPNIQIDVLGEEEKEIISNDKKPIAERISIEFSDIYDIV
ncbi:PAS domain-containing sensor histidine kinase [Clostridium septicum]|uniref:sensor histidine kinase n=1 Tax=Clostridium septicum TaxID=1504 RepID=UPI00082D4B15|nr:ATP-binding protein [Clostridium septicum]MDU1314606.1 ATP-binding protein [Clostridium septicum]WLF69763.1 ATP-binding protein [Clostridium septicum]